MQGMGRLQLDPTNPRTELRNRLMTQEPGAEAVYRALAARDQPIDAEKFSLFQQKAAGALDEIIAGGGSIKNCLVSLLKITQTQPELPPEFPLAMLTAIEDEFARQHHVAGQRQGSS